MGRLQARAAVEERAGKPLVAKPHAVLVHCALLPFHDANEDRGGSSSFIMGRRRGFAQLARREPRAIQRGGSAGTPRATREKRPPASGSPTSQAQWRYWSQCRLADHPPHLLTGFQIFDIVARPMVAHRPPLDIELPRAVRFGKTRGPLTAASAWHSCRATGVRGLW